MEEVRETTADFLAEHPELEDEFREMLAVDADGGPWDFHDIPLDSGAFGEVVSRGIVESQNGGYRVTDPDAVRAAIDRGDETETATTGDPIVELPSVDLDTAPSPQAILDPETVVSWVRRPAVGGVVLVFGLLAGVRSVSLPAVFRNGDIVLSGNDPYYYRYWVESLAAKAGGTFDLGTLTDLPAAVTKGEPLMVATLWWITELLGGGAHTAGVVLAIYPVASAVVTGVFVYWIAVRAFADRRAGLAAVAMLALIPAHGFRTSLGFADHHAFDYPWLALTLLGLVVVADADVRRLTSRGVWLGSAVIAVGVAGQTLAWEAGPLLIGAVGAYLAVRVLADVRADASSVLANLPVVVGLAGAAVVTHLVHTSLGWHTDQVTYAPLLLLLGVLVVVGLAEVAARLSLPPSVVVGTEALSAVVGWVAFQAFLPTYAGRLNSRLAFLFSETGIVEMGDLLAPGAIVRPLLLLGFVIVLGVPYAVWGMRRGYREYRPAWLAVGAYVGYFLALTLIQIRFGSELAPPLAVFAGLGFVHLASRLDLARTPVVLDTDTGASGATGRGGESGAAAQGMVVDRPDRRAMLNLALLFLLVGGLGFVQIPVKTSQLTITDETYRAAVWIETDAEDRGLTYPENYVLSRWGRNRVFNYFVNGHSRSYGYARETYGEFLVAESGGEWYRRLRGRVGYVVTQQGLLPDPPPRTLYARLHRHFGSRSDRARGLAHYRAVWTSRDGSMKVFLLVPGATITGIGPANGTLRLSTPVAIPGANVTYARRVRVNEAGNYSVVVAYPGTYTVGNETVTVPERAVMNGTRVRV